MRDSTLNTVGAGILFQAVTFGISVYSFTFFVLPWSEEFGVVRAEIMTVTLLMSIGGGVLSPLIGKLLDRTAARKVVAVGMLLFASGLILAGVATKFWHIVIAFGLLVGPGMTLAGPLSAQVLVARAVPAGKRGFALGWVLTGTSIGGILLPPLIALSIEAFGWRTAIACVGPGAALVLTPLVWALAPARSPHQPSATDTPGMPPVTPRAWSTLSTLKDVRFWVPLLVLTPSMAAFAAVQANLDPFGRELGFAPSQTSLMMSFIAGTMIASKIVFGYLSDRCKPEYLALVMITGMVASLTMLANTLTFAVAVFACILLGTASGSSLPLLAAMLVNRYGEDRFALALGLAMPVLTIAGFGPLLAGWMYDTFGGYMPVFLSLGAVSLVGGLLGFALSLLSRGSQRTPRPSIRTSALAKKRGR